MKQKACGGCSIVALAASCVVGVTRAEVWQPVVNATWQWQLQFQVNTSFDVDMYDVDLFGEMQHTTVGSGCCCREI